MGNKLYVQIIEIYKRQITLEVTDDTPYQSDGEYEVWVNEDRYGVFRQNVITIDTLVPDTEYGLTIKRGDESVSLTARTKCETVLLDVRSFGAVGDGVHNDTSSIQAAVSACPDGGTVYIAEGTYYTTPVFLKSHVSLWIDENAEILASPYREDYPILPGIVRREDYEKEVSFGSWEGNPLDSFASVFTAIGCEDIEIVGAGTINGNGAKGDWWEDPKTRRIAWRPRVLFFNRCRDIRLQGVHIMNSPSWTVHPYYCDNVKILNVTIENPSDSPNTDGIDPECVTNLLILGTRVSVGDDCVALKSGKLYMSRNHYKRTEHVKIRNCLFESGHGSVTIGSEIAAGVTDLNVEKCIFRGTDRGIRLKTRRGRGDRSVLDGLHFQNIRMEHVHMPLVAGMFYFCDPDGHSEYVQSQEYHPVDDRTPRIGTITVRDVTCTGADESFVCVYGLPEQKIEELYMEHVSVEFLPESERRLSTPLMMDGFPEMSGRSIYANNVKKLVLSDVKIAGSADSAPELIGVDETEMENLRYE